MPVPTSSHSANSKIQNLPSEIGPLTSLIPSHPPQPPTAPEIRPKKESRQASAVGFGPPTSRGGLTHSPRAARTEAPREPQAQSSQCPRTGPARENGSSLTSGSSARSSLPWTSACPVTKAPAGRAAHGATIDPVQAAVHLNQTGRAELHSDRSQRKRPAPTSPRRRPTTLSCVHRFLLTKVPARPSSGGSYRPPVGGDRNWSNETPSREISGEVGPRAAATSLSGPVLFVLLDPFRDLVSPPGRSSEIAPWHWKKA